MAGLQTKTGRKRRLSVAVVEKQGRKSSDEGQRGRGARLNDESSEEGHKIRR